MRKLWLFLVLAAFIGGLVSPVLAESQAADSPTNALPKVAIFSPEIQAQLKLAELRKLQAQNDWVALQKNSRAFVNWAKQYKQIEKLTLVGYDFLVTSLENQGRYAMAADAVREKNQVKPESGNIDKVMAFEQKRMIRDEYYKKTIAFHNEKAKMQKSILDLAKEKAKLSKELLAKKDVSREDMKVLQGRLRELETKMDSIRKEISTVHEKYVKDTEKYREEKILFNPEQRAAIQDKIHAEVEIAKDVQENEKQVRENLVQISEKFKVSWNGLEEKLSAVKDVQNKLMKLQEELLGLLAKKPLTDADKKLILAKQEEMEKLIAQEEKLYAELEKAFMDAKIFDNMNDEQAKKFMDLFKVIRDAKEVIAKTDKKIDELIKQMKFMFGDINGDGKIDASDLKTLLTRFLMPRPWPFQCWFPYNPNLIKAADLDGDGRITWSDYHLLAEAVKGSRKVFPVDPENKPGDFNGNGIIDEEDVEIMSKVMNVANDRLKKVWKRIADLNGDGKVDAKDMIELVKNLTNKVEPQPAPADAPNGTATAPIGTETAPVASGTGEASGNTPTTTNNAEGQPASNMNQGF